MQSNLPLHHTVVSPHLSRILTIASKILSQERLISLLGKPNREGRTFLHYGNMLMRSRNSGEGNISTGSNRKGGTSKLTTLILRPSHAQNCAEVAHKKRYIYFSAPPAAMPRARPPRPLRFDPGDGSPDRGYKGKNSPYFS
jgi:hypothetical protein